MVWHTGKKLNGGQYTIERVLGQGGFGITYLARTTNNENVAIKTLNDEIQSDPNFVKHQSDIVEETLRLKTFSHTNIVKIHDLFIEDNRILGGLIPKNLLPCLVMEYIPGKDLLSVLQERGVLPEAEALKYIKQIGQALTIVHEQGLLHRDIKPQNIMLRNDGSAVLIDFGIAREFIQDKTALHTQFHTPGFAPPEQRDFLQTKRGAYTDIYALAATLYVLLTGELPQRNNSTLESPQTLNSLISDRVNQAIIKGMEWKPEDRPQSIEAWLKMLAPKKKKKSKSTKIKPTVVRSRYGSRWNNTLNTESWIWVLWSFVFWVVVSYVCMILPINSISNHLEVSASIRSMFLAFLTITIAIFAPSSEMELQECWEERPILWGIPGAIVGAIVGAVLGITSVHSYDSDYIDQHGFWIISTNIFVYIIMCSAVGSRTSSLISLILGFPSVILGKGKINLDSYFYFNEFVTSLVVIVASLLGIGLGWLMFVYI